MRKPTRAVTCEDFERIAREAIQGARHGWRVQRAKCFPRCDLAATTEADRRRDRPGHMSVIFVPEDPWAADETVRAIQKRVQKYLERRRLLTCRVHVHGPRYLDLGIRIRVVTLPGSSRNGVEKLISRELTRFFEPLHGGPQRSGWPFGRSVYTSDIYRLVETIEGVDYVTAVEFDIADPSRLHRNEAGEAVEVRLHPEELVRVRVSSVVFDLPVNHG